MSDMIEAERVTQTESPAADTAQPRANAMLSFLPDPGAVLAMLRRRIWWFLLPFLLTIGLAAAYLIHAKPRYEALSTIVIEPRATSNVAPTSTENAGSGVPLGNDEVDTEVQILGSTAIAGRVADALHIERYPEFKTDAPIVYDRSQPSTHPLAWQLLQHVTVRRAGLTYVIAITASSKDPELAAKIANAFAEQYLADRVDEKDSTTRRASVFLGSRLDKLRADAVGADADLQRYKVEHGLMSAEGATMAEQEVSSLNQEIARARADYAEKLGRLNAARQQIRQGGGGADVQAALTSTTISDLRSKEAESSRKLADLSAHYGDLYPDVIRQRQELSDIRQQIDAEIARIVSSLQAEATAAGSRLSSLVESQQHASGSLAANGSAQVSLLELQRKAEANSALYQAYLNRSKETLSREGLNGSDARIGALSRVPILPVSPKVPLIAGGGLVIALLLGLIGVGVGEYLDAGIATKADVERKLRVRYLGAVPDLQSTLGGLRNALPPQDYILEHPHSAFSEAFRNLRTVMLSKAGQKAQVIAVTSALPQEGKSTTSISLARMIAGTGANTILVDCDIRRRTTSEVMIGDPEGDGLLRFFAGAELDACISKDSATELKILGTNKVPDADKDYFSGANIKTLVSALRAQFDVIVLDTAPALALAETRDIASAADSLLMVARWRVTPLKAVDIAIEMLLAANVKMRGLVLTMVDVRRFASTGTQDVYGYHKKFKGYYVN